MSCYGNSKAPAVDLSRTVCNRMIANGGRGEAKQQQLNLMLRRAKGLSQKGQMNSLKPRSNVVFYQFSNYQTHTLKIAFLRKSNFAYQENLTVTKYVHNSVIVDN